MKTGKVFRVYKAHDGREFTLRTPRWDDLDDLLEYINSLFTEGAMISINRLMTREKEAEWLGRHLTLIENGKRIAVVAEINGKVVGQVGVNPRRGHSAHVGVIGIGLCQGYRDVGLGSELMIEAERLAKEQGMTHMSLEVYSKNDRAQHVYRKLGYTYVGREPDAINLNGEIMDNIYMYKKI